MIINESDNVIFYLACGVTSVPAKRIVGGTPSLPGAFPWIVKCHFSSYCWLY